MLCVIRVRVEEERREAQQLAKYKNKARVGFGSQIRNYGPEQRVKDSRTEYLQNIFYAVMDGDIQGFLESFLRWRMQQNAGLT